MTQLSGASRRELLDQLQVDEEGNIWMNGVPTVLMPAAFLREVKATGEKFMGRGLHGIIYHVGEQFGRIIAEESRARAPDEPEVLFSRIAKAVQVRGWGRIDVLSFDLSAPSC